MSPVRPSCREHGPVELAPLTDLRSIDGQLTKPTGEIVLNALKLRLVSAKIQVGGKTLESSSFRDDEQKQRVTVAFADELPASPQASLTIEFVGEINHDLAGFLPQPVQTRRPGGCQRPARRAVPLLPVYAVSKPGTRARASCFDEPNLKATFDFAIEIPDDQVALGNMPVRETRAAAPGKTLVSFERTPIMSTYLLAWAVGDYEYIEAFTEREYNGAKLPIRVYTTRGLKEKGRWALQHAPKIIDFFSSNSISTTRSPRATS